MWHRTMLVSFGLLIAGCHGGCSCDNDPSSEGVGGNGGESSSVSSSSGLSTGAGNTGSSGSGASGNGGGSPCGQGGNAWQGVLQFGSSEDDEGMSIATDAAGYVYVLGHTRGEWSDVPGPSQNIDMFVLKMVPAGRVEWSARLASNGEDTASKLAVTADGEMFVVGSALGAVDGQPYVGEKDFIVAHYDPSGQRTWLTQFGSSKIDTAKSITLHPSGDPVMVGYTLGNAAKDGEFVETRFAADSGLVISDKRFGTDSFDTATAIAYDDLGHAYICGHSTGSFGGPSSGSYDVVLMQYDLNGVQQWARQFGTMDIDGCLDVSTDIDGNAYLGAVSHSDLVNGTFEDDILRDAFIVKFDPQGTRAWTRRPSTQPDRESFVESIIAGPDGVYAAGWTEADLDGLPNRGGRDAFIVKYDFDGNLQWVRQYGTSNDDTIKQIVLDTQGDLHAVGTTSGNFLGQVGAGGSDVFVMKVDSLGQPL